MDEMDDHALVARANAGGREALEMLYRRHRDWVVNLAWRLLGDREAAFDVLQDTFAYFFEQFPGFRLTSSLRAFLFPVVRHRAYSLMRKRQRVVQLDSIREGASSPLSWQVTGDFERLLARLAEPQRDVLYLRFALGFRLEEIAEALQIPSGTVKSRLHHALRALRSLLEAENSSER